MRFSTPVLGTLCREFNIPTTSNIRVSRATYTQRPCVDLPVWTIDADDDWRCVELVIGRRSL